MLSTPIRPLKNICWPERYQSRRGRLTSVPPWNRSLMLNCHVLILFFSWTCWYLYMSFLPLKLLRILVSVFLYFQFHLSHLAWFHSADPLTNLSHIAIWVVVRAKVTQLAMSELGFGSLVTGSSGGWAAFRREVQVCYYRKPVYL